MQAELKGLNGLALKKKKRKRKDKLLNSNCHKDRKTLLRLTPGEC